MKQILEIPGKTSPMQMYIDTKCQQIAGRTAVVVFFLAFFSLYAYGIATFGVFLGIGIGWLPCVLIAWAISLATAQAIQLCLHFLSVREGWLIRRVHR